MMVDEFVNKLHDPIEVTFSWLEQQLVDINCNVKPLMVALSNKLWIFGGYGGLNEKEKSRGGYRHHEDTKNQLKKELRKYQPNLSVVNQSLFKIE